MGSQRHSEDFDGQIETSRWNFTEAVLSSRPALTDLLARNLVVKFPGITKISRWRDSALGRSGVCDSADFQPGVGDRSEIGYLTVQSKGLKSAPVFSIHHRRHHDNGRTRGTKLQGRF